MKRAGCQEKGQGEHPAKSAEADHSSFSGCTYDSN